MKACKMASNLVKKIMIIAALNPKILKFLCECEKTNLKISVQQVYHN